MGNKANIVEEYLQAIETSVGNSGSVHFWPLSPGQIDSYFIDIFAETFLEKLRQDTQRFKKAIFHLPANVLRWFFCPQIILGLKLARKFENYQVTENEMVDFLFVVYDVLQAKVESHPFCLDGENRIFKKKELSIFLKHIKWIENSNENKKLINYLSLDLESFVWSVDFDLFAYGVTWHGPYLLSANKTLLIKKFIDLNSEVWRNDIRFSNIDLLFLFSGPLRVKIDFMTHIFYSEPIWESLAKYAVFVDGIPKNNLEDIEKMSEYFSKQRQKQVGLVNALTPRELIFRGVEINYYMFRQFFEFYNEDWHPPRIVAERIEKWGLKYWKMFTRKKDEKPASLKYLRKLFDPRNDFTG